MKTWKREHHSLFSQRHNATLKQSLYFIVGRWFDKFIFWQQKLASGWHCIEMALLLLTQQPWVLFSAFPSMFLLMLLRFIDSTASNSEQGLGNVNRIHLAQASTTKNKLAALSGQKISHQEANTVKTAFAGQTNQVRPAWQELSNFEIPKLS